MSSTFHNSGDIVMSGRPRPRRHLYLLVFLSGWVTLGMEVLGPRILANVYGNTNVVWAVMIFVTLGGLSLGYLCGTWVPVASGSIVVSLCLGMAALLLAFVDDIVRLIADCIGQYSILAIGTTTLGAFLLPSALLGAVPIAVLSLFPVDQVRGGHRHAGRLYAIGTVGSLIGGLATSLWMVQHLGIEFTLRALSALAMLGAVMSALGRAPRTVLAIAGVASILRPTMEIPCPTVEKLLFRTEGAYQTIRIYGTASGERVSLWLGPTCASEYDPISRRAKATYLRAIMSVVSVNPPGTMLIIGGAGNALTLEAEDIGWTVDVVEIDPVVTATAQPFFGQPKGHIHTQDARAFLRWTNKNKYDVIITDAFAGPSMTPSHLTTIEYCRELKKAIADGGMVIMHMHGTLSGVHAGILLSFLATMRKVFPTVHVCPVSDQNRNSRMVQSILLCATSHITVLPTVDVQVPAGDNYVLTDDRNPLENLVLDMQQHLFSRRAWGWQSPAR